MQAEYSYCLLHMFVFINYQSYPNSSQQNVNIVITKTNQSKSRLLNILLRNKADLQFVLIFPDIFWKMFKAHIQRFNSYFKTLKLFASFLIGNIINDQLKCPALPNQLKFFSIILAFVIPGVPICSLKKMSANQSKPINQQRALLYR